MLADAACGARRLLFALLVSFLVSSLVSREKRVGAAGVGARGLFCSEWEQGLGAVGRGGGVIVAAGVGGGAVETGAVRSGKVWERGRGGALCEVNTGWGCASCIDDRRREGKVKYAATLNHKVILRCRHPQSGEGEQARCFIEEEPEDRSLSTKYSVKPACWFKGHYCTGFKVWLE